MRWTRLVLIACVALVIVGLFRDRASWRAGRAHDSPPDVGRARELFQRHCAICHGEGGNGDGRRQTGFLVPPRDLTSPLWRERATPETVFNTIRKGVPGTAMPAWPTLTDREVCDLVGFVMSLARNSAERTSWLRPRSIGGPSAHHCPASVDHHPRL